MNRSSFTLIELFITVAAISVLAVVAVLIINPTELLRQSRDSARVNGLATLNLTVARYASSLGSGSLGATSTLYVSIPDSTATSTAGDQCQGLGLSTSSLPSGWVYHCAASSTYLKIDGTGWVPINFRDANLASSMSVLPVDPISQTSTGQYYTYVAGSGSTWELTSLFESQKQIPLEGTDGGLDPAMYEIGNNLAISPFAHGMVGYWKFDGGSGSTAVDSSGNATTLTITNHGTWTTGKIGGALSGDGVNSSASSTSPAAALYLPTTKTISLWLKFNGSIGSFNDLFSTFDSGEFGYPLYAVGSDLGALYYVAGNGADSYHKTTQIIAGGTWYHFAAVHNGTTQTVKLYINGSYATPQGNESETVGGGVVPYIDNVEVGGSANAIVDELRVYSRALSATEVNNLYVAR